MGIRGEMERERGGKRKGESGGDKKGLHTTERRKLITCQRHFETVCRVTSRLLYFGKHFTQHAGKRGLAGELVPLFKFAL